jgi:hypothetical protein
MDGTAAASSSLVQRFTDVWARPTPATLAALVTEDARLLQPARAPIVGRDAVREDFERLLQWQPHLHGIVDDWAQRDRLYIALRLVFTLGGRPFELATVDAIVVRDGLMAERTANFDSLALVLAVLRHPSEWRGAVRYLRG